MKRYKTLFPIFLLLTSLALTRPALASGTAVSSVYVDDDELRHYYRGHGIFASADSRSGFFGSLLSPIPSKLPPQITPLSAKKAEILPVFTAPNDTFYGTSYLWGISKINVSSVWNTYKGQGIKIAIVDTGILYSHEDIASNIYTNPGEIAGNGIDDDRDGFVDDVRGWDFVDNDNNATDLNGHGTHVAGIAAAVGDNAKGIIGVAPLAKIIPVRVLDAFGSGSLLNVAKGIEYAVRAGANIINLSLGVANLNLASVNLLQKAVDFATSMGRFVVAAAGNSNANVNNFSPANLKGVISVGATDRYDTRAYFSNYGSSLFITAPGVDILSLDSKQTHIGTALTNDYYMASGTSMAAPFVSGALALLMNKYPGASLDFIKNQLAAGATDLGTKGRDSYYGYGRLNVAASMSTVVAVTTTSVSTTGVALSGKTSTTTKSSAVDEFLNKMSDAIPDFFPEPNLEVTAEDIERASASLQFTGQTTYQEKDNTLENFYKN